MESNAVELDLKQYTEEEQEAMVSNDVMSLEIKRLGPAVRAGRQGLYVGEQEAAVELSMAKKQERNCRA